MTQDIVVARPGVGDRQLFPIPEARIEHVGHVQELVAEESQQRTRLQERFRTETHQDDLPVVRE